MYHVLLRLLITCGNVVNGGVVGLFKTNMGGVPFKRNTGGGLNTKDCPRARLARKCTYFFYFFLG